MGPLGLFARIEASLRRDRRRRFVAAGLSLAAVASVAVAVYFAAFAGGGSPAVVGQPTPGAVACDEAPSIDAIAQSPSDDWRSVAAPTATSCFSVTASGGDASGVPVDASFVVESTEPVNAQALAAKISVTPHFEFDLQPISSGQAAARPVKVAVASRYRIQPRAPLAEDTVYRVTVMDASGERPVHEWSFQTRRTLRVVSTLPADQATDVPLNIGIELTFSHAGVEGVENNFRIQPAVDGSFETHKRTVVFVPQALQAQTLYTVTLGSGVSVADTDLTLSPFTFSFETGTSDRSGETPTAAAGLQFSRRVWESGTSETPALALFRFSNNGNVDAGGLSLPFTVYRFADRDAYLASLQQFTAIPSWATRPCGDWQLRPRNPPGARPYQLKLGGDNDQRSALADTVRAGASGCRSSGSSDASRPGKEPP